MARRNSTTKKPKLATISKAIRETRSAYLAESGLLSRITVNPRVLHGKACVRGLRIPVYLIVGLVARGLSFDEILGEYPDLERDDIKAALEYAAFVTRENVIPADPNEISIRLPLRT